MTAILQNDALDDLPVRRFTVREVAALCALAVLLVSAMAIGGYALWTEIVAAQAETLATDVVEGGTPAAAALQPLAQVESLCLFKCQPRVFDAAAAIRLAAAAALPADERQTLLARATHDLDRAQAAEPFNGSVAIHQAYAASLTPGAPIAAVLQKIERSYSVQAYSKSGGLWRITGVVHNWALASPNLKSDALREALWLPATSDAQKKVVTDLFESSGLGLQLQLARSLPPI
jgi:hypothetical protein